MLEIIIVILLIIALQIFLSKQENEWLGLILPLISVTFSTILFVGLTVTKFFFIPALILVVIYLIYTNHVKKNNEFEHLWLALISPYFISLIIAPLIYTGGVKFILLFITMLVLSGIYLLYTTLVKKNYELKHHSFVLISFISLIIIMVVYRGGINTFILVYSIPTLILIGFYVLSRSYLVKNNELDKMSIQDL